MPESGMGALDAGLNFGTGGSQADYLKALSDARLALSEAMAKRKDDQLNTLMDRNALSYNVKDKQLNEMYDANFGDYLGGAFNAASPFFGGLLGGLGSSAAKKLVKPTIGGN